MTTGTKTFLAVFALIVGILVIYYGVMVPGRNGPPNGKSGDKVAANTPRPEDASKPHEPGSGGGAGGARPTENHPATPPPARDPAPLSPPPASPPLNASSAGGLLTEAVHEAEHPGENLPGQAQPAANVPANPSNAILPLMGLNGGDLKSPTGSDSPKGDAAPPKSAAPTAGKPDPHAPATAVTPAPAANQPRQLPGADRSLQKPQRTEYIIKSGDTFVSIADAWFGETSKWSLIAKENPTIDPQRLKVGQKIYLPAKDAAKTSAKTEPVVANGEGVYIVQSGDTLSSIAREVFKDGKRWEEIYKLNQDVIGKDAGTLKVGMRLKLPKK